MHEAKGPSPLAPPVHMHISNAVPISERTPEGTCQLVGSEAGLSGGVSYWMVSAVVALDSALAFVRRTGRGTVRVPGGRRDCHGCLQRDVGVLTAHRAAVDEPAAIWLVLG